MLNDRISGIITPIPLADEINHSVNQKDLLPIIVTFIVLAYACAMTVLIWRGQTKRKLWTARGAPKSTEKSYDRICLKIYRTMKSTLLTRDYIEKLSYQFRLISPCDSKEIARRTVGTCIICVIFSITIFLFLFITNPKLITMIITVAAILILNHEVAGRMAKSFEIKLNLEIQQLIENEVHNYYVNYRVDDALYLSIDSLSPNMRVAADQIYQLLLSDDREQALREYYENIPNRYLREFVSLCVGVAERGDGEVNGKHIFVRNLENLYSQLEIEIDKLQRINMEFAGVILIVILPIFCIDLVKWFCISIKENMGAFYYGKTGFLIDVGLLAVIGAIYTIMHKSAEYRTFHQSTHQWLHSLDRLPWIRKAMDNYSNKNASKMEGLRRVLKNNGYNITPRHFVLRSFLLAVAVFCIGLGVTAYLDHSSREAFLIADRGTVASLTSAADEKQYDRMIHTIQEYTKSYVLHDKKKILRKMPDQQEGLKNLIQEEFYNKLVAEALAREIWRRVEEYRASYVSLTDVILCMLLGICSYFLPSVLLSYGAAVSRDTAEDEVHQFNALIGMLMYDKTMTVKKLLIEMESFAVIFKQSLRNCINNYGAGDDRALDILREEEPYGAFVRIIDNLMRCDDMPIYEAFHEADTMRDGYLSKRKLANEKSIRKRVLRAYILAAVPFLLLFAYGIIPTLQASIYEITQTLKVLEGTW